MILLDIVIERSSLVSLCVCAFLLLRAKVKDVVPLLSVIVDAHASSFCLTSYSVEQFRLCTQR